MLFRSTTQGGNYWTLITPEIWKGLYAVLQQWPWDTSRWASASCFAASCRRPGWRNARRWWQARADIRAAATRRLRAALLCLSLSRSRPPEQAKKQTDGPQTRANTRLLALNAQEGSREQRESGRKVRRERRLPEGHAQEDTAGNLANTGGTGKKNPNRIRVGISHYGAGVY